MREFAIIGRNHSSVGCDGLSTVHWSGSTQSRGGLQEPYRSHLALGMLLVMGCHPVKSYNPVQS